MRGFAKYWLLLLPCIAFAFALSYYSFYSYYFAARWFHSVHAVRVSESMGNAVLFPARAVFACFGGLFDQSTPVSDPLNYVMINAVLLGSALYACLRPLVFREKKPAE